MAPILSHHNVGELLTKCQGFLFLSGAGINKQRFCSVHNNTWSRFLIFVEDSSKKKDDFLVSIASMNSFLFTRWELLEVELFLLFDTETTGEWVDEARLYCNVTEVDFLSALVSKMFSQNESFDERVNDLFSSEMCTLHSGIYAVSSWCHPFHNLFCPPCSPCSSPLSSSFTAGLMVFSTVHVLSRAWTAHCPPPTRLCATVIPPHPHSNINQHTPRVHIYPIYSFYIFKQVAGL